MIVIRTKETYEIGDVVTFTRPGGGIVTHRIIKATDTNSFVSRGDANEAIDAVLVNREQILGRLMFAIPIAGALFAILRTHDFIFILGGTFICFIEGYKINRLVRKKH